jgi:hypothetical protein
VPFEKIAGREKRIRCPSEKSPAGKKKLGALRKSRRPGKKIRWPSAEAPAPEKRISPDRKKYEYEFQRIKTTTSLRK